MRSSARVITFASAKASPGVTTTALLCAAGWPSDAVLVEADESGGVLAPRLGVHEEPGALQLAGAARDDLDLATTLGCCQRTQTGLPVLVAPPEPAQVVATFRELAPRLAALTENVTWVVDGGRLRSASSAVWPLCRRGLVVLVARTRLDEFRAFAATARDLRSSGARVAGVLIAEGPYPPEEFAATAGVDLLAVLPHDPVAAATLRGELAPRVRLRRSPLWTAAEELVAHLAGVPNLSGNGVVATGERR